MEIVSLVLKGMILALVVGILGRQYKPRVLLRGLLASVALAALAFVLLGAKAPVEALRWFFGISAGVVLGLTLAEDIPDALAGLSRWATHKYVRRSDMADMGCPRGLAHQGDGRCGWCGGGYAAAYQRTGGARLLAWIAGRRLRRQWG